LPKQDATTQRSILFLTAVLFFAQLGHRRKLT